MNCSLGKGCIISLSAEFRIRAALASGRKRRILPSVVLWAFRPSKTPTPYDIRAAAGEILMSWKGMNSPSSQTGSLSVSPRLLYMQSVSVREKVRVSQSGSGLLFCPVISRCISGNWH